MAIDLTVLKAGVEFAAAAKKLLKRKKSKEDFSLADNLSRALRTLYFTPSGVLSFLKEIESGLPVTSERIQTALTKFNDREWQVDAALNALDFDRLTKELELNIATTAFLDQLRWGKINLRQQIQDEINYYGQRGVRPDRQRVKMLIVAIEELNRSIEEIEALVNARARAQ